ncbi:MAG: excinuclease ABC subunit C [bacterium TMED80]|nr:MAG: excinuclease ABC subunit C [bacterium TMED80]
MKKNSELLKNLPTFPGVYTFKDKDEKIIYIGKAKNLKNRIRSYFQNSKTQSSKTISMMKNADSFEWIIVKNEVEALLTEANLIKKHRPKYNILMKDDKTYPYIQITKEPYPQVLLTRKIKKDGSKYFGPYTDSKRLRTILKVIHKVFPIRSCSYFIDDKIIEQKKISICLDYHIKRCQGPCEGLVSEKEYNEMIMHVISFMKGSTKEIEYYVEQKMNHASKNLLYEEAALFRDQLRTVQNFSSKKSYTNSVFDERDIFALAKKDGIGVAVVIRIRNGFIYSREKISVQNIFSDEQKSYSSIITQFYMGSNLIPANISLPIKLIDEKNILDMLSKERGAKVKLEYPQIGEKAKELRITMKNAELLLNDWILRKNKYKMFTPNSITSLQSDLNLDVPPKNIEGFDISHLGGTNTVASMVSFINGRPKKSNYRKYKIKSVKNIDDFASIREVVFRRYSRLQKENSEYPDLILIDGGKGQLSMAKSALRELGLDYINIIGLAKRLEEVFIPGNPEAQVINKKSPGLILLKRVRDEAHRFAISFQKQKRKKTMTESPYSSIKGVGKITLNKLLIEYDGTEDIARQTPKSLAEKIGLSEKLSGEIVAMALSLSNNT